MTGRNTYLLILIGLFFGSCSPDADGPSPEDAFVRYYGQQGQQKAIDLMNAPALQRAQHNVAFIILGSQDMGLGTDFFLIKADSAGNQLDTATIGAGDRNDVPAKIKPISDQEFAVIGTSSSLNGQDQWLYYAILNYDLQVVREYTIKAVINGDSLNLEGADIVAVPGTNGQNDYLLLGTVKNVDGSSDIFISKRDINNERIWLRDKILGYGGPIDDKALALFRRNSGNLVIVGSTERTESGYSGINIAVFVTNELGTDDVNTLVTGVSLADHAADDIPNDAIQKGDNAYVIVGETKTTQGVLTSFQIHIDGSAGLTSENILNEFLDSKSPIPNQAYAVTRTHFNEYVVVGKLPNYAFNGESKLGEMMIARTDQSGAHVSGYDQNMGLISGDDEANAVVTTDNGDIAVAATVDFGSGIKLIGLLKLNRFGQLK